MKNKREYDNILSNKRRKDEKTNEKFRRKTKEISRDCPEISKGNNKGITLIALIITIIVMLILVGVTINVALNGGIFEKAKTAATKTEEQAIYDKIVGEMDLGDNGKILVKETYSVAKNMLQGEEKTVNLVSPATEEEITNSVIFEVVGNNGTYTYTITEEKIIIGKEKEKIYSFTLNSLGEWIEETDSRIAFDLSNVWNVLGEDLSNNNKYAFNMDGEKMFALESEDERFLSVFIAEANQDAIGEKVQFVMFAETDGTQFKFAVANKTMEELLSNIPSEGQMTHQEFMDTYGDIEFRFTDASSISTE